MASITKTLPSPQDNILCCPICMDVYKSPRMLPCQHTMCEICLNSYIVNKSKERVLVSDFPCPVCRASTPAPRAFTRIDTWSSLFPLNHLLVSLLDSSLHEVLERKSGISTPTLSIDRCADHSGKQIEFFCVEHDVKLCSKCFKNSHRQCDVLDIEEHVEFTSRLSTIKSDVENFLSYLTGAITHLRSNIDMLFSQKNTILAEVKDFRGKVEALLNSIESDINDQVNAQHDGEMIVMQAQCEKYERIKCDIDATVKTLSELPVSGNIAQSLETISAVEDEIKNHLSFIQGCHSNLKLIKLEFTIEHQLLAFLNSFGQVGNVSINRFEADVIDPPEMQPRDITHEHLHIPSREVNPVSYATDEIRVQRSPVRHLSPGTIFVSRSPFQTIPSTDISAQGTVSQTAESQPEQRPQKEQRRPRPKTVPIDSTAPTPVVRPRPERPVIRAGHHFLPRSASSPANQARAFNSSGAASNSHVTQSDRNAVVSGNATLDMPLAANTAGNAATHARDSTATGNHSNTSESTASVKPAVAEKTKHRAWQYVNIMSGVGDLATRETTGSDQTSAENTSASNSLKRHKSFTSSNLADEENKVTSMSSKPASVNQIVRSFQHKVDHKSDRATSQQDGGTQVQVTPLYENALLASVPSTPTTERSFTFNTLPKQTSARVNSKYCTRMKDITVRHESDARECTITGSAEMADKRLILVDCNNSRIKLFNADLVFVSHLNLNTEPWNVVTISANEIAVTVPLEKTIHIVRVSASSLSTQRCIMTHRECWGIAYLDRKYIITTKDDGNMVVFLDENGRELQLINFSSHENPNILRPVSISLFTRDAALYICCEGQSGTKGSIVRMSHRGDIRYIYTHKELDRPYSASASDTGNVYVAAIRSSNVMMLNDDPASAMTILSRDMGLTRPQHIHVTSWEEKTVLILTERRSDTASVYCMK